MGADAAAEELFGPYVVYERLGVGGMATVHRALERGIEGFERIVALKRLLPHLAADATFIKSFVREAKLASLLNHVNIVQIFELGRVATQYFISMEYIDGRDIRRILRHARKVSGPPPIHVTVGLLLQLCDALEYAHHKIGDDGHPLGLVHRDVSPSNVLVTSTGQVKVIDFGIAKAQSAQLRTQTGRVKGKLAYMAPEALAGKDLDARSDLFAAGVIAHELLTARPLFASKNEYQTLMKLQRGEVMPPSTFNQSCPPELDAIVLRALAHDPEHRFRHAGELRDELHAMRKQFNLQVADRDIASWLDWAFSLEAPEASAASGSGAGAGSATGHTGHPRPTAHGHPRHRAQRAPRRHDDDEAVELAWGSHDEQVSGEPVVLDDVPDVSDKHLGNPSALGAEVRLDLDDLADDIPTPQPGHGRPPVVDRRSRIAGGGDPDGSAGGAGDLPRGINLSSRTVTTPLLPRHFARNKAQARTSQALAVPSEPDGRPTVPIPEAVSARLAAPIVDDDGVTQSNAAIAADQVPLVPSRARTITVPPRNVPSSSSPPRSVAAAALPSRAAPVAAEPSRGVPMPMAPSRSAAITAQPSRGVPFPAGSPLAGAAAAEPSRGVPFPAGSSRSGAVAAEPARRPTQPPASRGNPIAPERPRTAPGATEPSQGVPVPIEPSYVGPSPAGPSRSAPATGERSRSELLPAPGTSPPAGATASPPSEPRDPLRDTIPTERAPTFPVEELGLAADTMPAMPAMPGGEPAQGHEPTATTLQAVPPSFEPGPVAGPPGEPPPPAEVKTSTRRQRLITPATALFAEPDPEAHTTALAASGHGVARPSHSTLSGERGARRRVTLGRVLLVIAALALLSAATTAAALYLTRDDAPDVESRPMAAPAPTRHAGTIHFEVTPADSAISIAGQPVHTGSPWDVELAPGVHQIEIDRDGYKSWLTAIEIVAGQTRPVRVSLEPYESHPAEPPAGEPATPPPGPATGPSPAPPAATAPAPRPTPVAVPSTAVNRLAGAPPRITPPANVDLPAAITAKLCIDEAGRVAVAEMITPLPAEIAAQIVGTLRTWQYAPYRAGGAAQPACFPVTFRAK